MASSPEGSAPASATFTTDPNLSSSTDSAVVSVVPSSLVGSAVLPPVVDRVVRVVVPEGGLVVSVGDSPGHPPQPASAAAASVAPPARR